MLEGERELKERILADVKKAAAEGNLSTIAMLLRNYSSREDKKLIMDVALEVYLPLADTESILKLSPLPDDCRALSQSQQADLTLKALLHEGFNWHTTCEDEVIKASLQSPPFSDTLKALFETKKTLGPSELYWAAACGQLDEVNRLASELRAKNLPIPTSALNIASLCGHLEVVKTLWAQRKDDQAAPSFAVALAALGRHPEVVKYNLEQNFPVNQALACAIRANHSEIAKQILQFMNSDVGQRDFYGQLPLKLAMQQDCGVVIIPLMINRYDDNTLQQTKVNKDNLLDYCCQHEMVFEIRHLLGRNLFVWDRKEPLGRAVRAGSIPVVMALLKGDNEYGELYQKALEDACCYGKTELVQPLLAKKDEILQKYPKLNWLNLLNTCMTQMNYHKVMETHADVLVQLCSAGACSNHRDTRALAESIKRDDLRVALEVRYQQQIAALRAQHPESYSNQAAAMENPDKRSGLYPIYEFKSVVEKSTIDHYSLETQYSLLQSDRHRATDLCRVLEDIYYNVILPEAFKNSSVNPFLYAAQSGLLAAMKTEWPAGKEAPKLLSEALTLAGKNGHREVVNYLLEQGAEPYPGFFTAVCKTGQLEILKTVLADRPNANASSGLPYACVKNRPQMFDAVLARSSTPDEKDGDGLTALLNACQFGYTEFVRKLIAAKANLELIGLHKHTRTSVTPLMEACDSSADTTAIIELLLAEKVRVDAKNSDGQTAAYFAVKNGKLDLVKRLLEVCPAAFKSVTKEGESLLGAAILYRKPALIEYLLEKTEGPDWSALQCACQMGRLDLVKILLARYTNPLSHQDLKTALYAAKFDGGSYMPEETAGKVAVAEYINNLLNPPMLAPVQQQPEVDPPQPGPAELPVVAPLEMQNQPNQQPQAVPKPPAFKTDPRFAAMQKWLKEHFDKKSSLFEINTIKYKLMNAALTQLGEEAATKSTQELMHTLVRIDAKALGLTDKQQSMLRKQYGLNLNQEVRMSELAAMKRNAYSRGFTDCSLYFLQGQNFHLSKKELLVAYLAAVDDRLAATRFITKTTRVKMMDLHNAGAQIKASLTLNADSSLDQLLQTEVQVPSKQKRTVASILGDHRIGFGLFKPRSIRDLKLLFKSDEVDQALRPRRVPVR